MAEEDDSALFYINASGVPVECEEENTGRMLKASIGELATMGNMPQANTEQLLEEALSRVIAKHTGPPRKHFALGLTIGDYAKGAALVAAIAGAWFALKTTVETNTQRIIESDGHAKEAIGEIRTHKVGDHKELEVRLGTVERTIDRVEYKQDQALEVMQEIKTEVVDERRAARRRSRE